MAVRLLMNNYVSKLIELCDLGYDAQLVFTCVDGHMGINLQQSILARETVSHRYSQNEHHGRKPTQPQVRRREPQVRRREQPAKRRRRERRAAAREMVGEAAAQVPSSHHQLPVQPGATSHAPPASALAWPIHYEPEDQSPPHLQPAHQVGLLPPQCQHQPAADKAAFKTSDEPTGASSLLPTNPPAEKSLLAGQAVEPSQVVAEEAAEQAAFPSPVPPPFTSFSFQSHTDSPVHPPPSSSSTRRATLRRIRQKPSDILLQIRKPARILKTVLNKNIGRGLWTIYLSEGNCEGIVNFVPFGVKCEPVSYLL